MISPFFYLCIQTIFLWSVVFFLHSKKDKITLIPLYSFLAILTLLTHNLSDLGFAVIVHNWYFFIASFSYFTALMLGILFIYLFEGPRATRFALLVILGVSFFYISVVALINVQVDTSKWVYLTSKSFVYYFWSIAAIVIDVFFISIFWEALGKIKLIPLLGRIFIVIVGTYFLDAVVFVSGVFGGQDIYFSMLQGNLTIRFILALIVTPLIGFNLHSQGYKDDRSGQQKNVWEILNFRSDLESKIETLEEAMRVQKELKEKLALSQERFQLALEGVNAGIWDWNVQTGVIMFSTRFSELLGYEKGDLPDTIEAFKEYIHTDDREMTFAKINSCFQEKKTLSLEYRLKNKNGNYKWYLKGGKATYNEAGKPMRMVGSIIDIDEKKQVIASYEEKTQELEKMNRLMVGRELQMINLKEEIKKIKSS